MKKLTAAFCVALTLTLVCVGLYVLMFAPDSSSELLLSLGLHAEQKGRQSRAAYFYEQALTLNPYSVQARLHLTALLRRQCKNTRAEELLREGIAHLPSNAAFYTELSSLLVGQGRLSDAVQALNGAGSGVAGLRIGSLRPTVQASPAPGVYSRPVLFRITAEPGLSYYYTLDGSVPDLSSARYTAPLSLTNSTVYHIRVIALGGSSLPSRLYEYTYDLTGLGPRAVASGGGFSVCPHCGRSF